MQKQKEKNCKKKTLKKWNSTYLGIAVELIYYN